MVRRHFVDKVAVSDLCDEYKIQPSLFYQWQRQALENLAQAIEPPRGEHVATADGAGAQDRFAGSQGGEERQHHCRDLRGVRRVKKRAWGALNGRWVPHDTRDEVIDFVTGLAEKTELKAERMVGWIGIAHGKFYEWKKRYGKANEHNGKVPRDHWIDDWERERIIEFHGHNPLEGYRRLMMLDAGIVAVSPSTPYRVLSRAGLLDRWNRKPSKKGGGFVQPEKPHQHWHIDISYLNVSGTFYYLCAVLDGYSRAIVHWEIGEAMKEVDVGTIVQRAREKYPEARPRIISDNGPQFIARDFKEFIRIAGMTHVRTSPYYPQSNGKLEAFHRTLKVTTIRPKQPGTLEEARRVVGEFVEHYNNVRLHSAIGYVSPAAKLAGLEQAIWKERDRRLEAAREQRRRRREGAIAA